MTTALAALVLTASAMTTPVMPAAPRAANNRNVISVSGCRGQATSMLERDQLGSFV